MKKSEQIKQIKSAIKAIGRKYDECDIYEDDFLKDCIGASFRTWDVAKEIEYQDRENIAWVGNRMNKELKRALYNFSIVKDVQAFHGDKNYFDIRVSLKSESKKSPKKKASKKSKKASSKSNKAVAYLAWKDGEKDVDKLHELVNKNVKKSTIKSWLSGWANGRSLPAIAK